MNNLWNNGQGIDDSPYKIGNHIGQGRFNSVSGLNQSEATSIMCM